MTFTTDTLGYFTFKLKIQNPEKPPKRLVIKASKNGYFPTVKILAVTDNIIDTISGVDIVIFHLPSVTEFDPSDGAKLRTGNNAIIKVPPGTNFVDNNDNPVLGRVKALLKFIDRNPIIRLADEIETSPGEFISEGEKLLSFSVFNLIFQDLDANPIKPKDDIVVQIVNTYIPSLTLWKLNDNGRWKQLAGGGGISNQTNIQIVGYLRPKHIGKWFNLGKLDKQTLCYVKLRVFDDVSFTKEVLDGQADLYTPQFLHRIQNGSHFRSSMVLWLDPVRGTRSPGKDCHTVRCTDIENISGGISVFATETLGNMISMAVPAIPIPLDHPALPASLKVELTALNYTIDWDMATALLKFENDNNGPFYTDKQSCKSAGVGNSLWFARRVPQFSDNAFGDKVCFARVRIYFEGFKYVFIDSMTGTSVWGLNPSKFATDVVYGVPLNGMRAVSTSIPTHFRLFACLRYRCSDIDDLKAHFILRSPLYK